MKKIILIVLFSLLFSGVVTASSTNGDYKGNPIVLIKSDGKTLETDEVPGQIIDGHTMVPISMLRQLGASVTWDVYNYTVDVKLPKEKDPLSFNISSISKDMKPYGVNSVSYNSDGDSSSITYYYNNDINGISNDQFSKIIFSSAATDATVTMIYDGVGNKFSVQTQAVRDLVLGKITAEELGRQYKIEKSNNMPSSTYNQPVTQQTPQQVLENQVQPNQQNNSNHEVICNNLHDKYILEKFGIDQLSPFNGSSILKKQQFEIDWNIKFAQVGCQKPN